MADPARARRLAVRIRQIVSATIEMQIKDPRLGMVTITDARVTSDLREATVFYTVFGDETQIADSAKALASATGVLRSTVGKQTGIKFVPTLTFVADIVPDTARELELALERVRHADAELARAREGAQYAGEPDPYRRPAEDDDLDDDDLGHRDGDDPDDGAPEHAPAALERDDVDRDVLSRDELTASSHAQPTGVPHD
jgi:ribosome-binding factor A